MSETAVGEIEALARIIDPGAFSEENHPYWMGDVRSATRVNSAKHKAKMCIEALSRLNHECAAERERREAVEGELAGVTELHRHDRQMWDATRRRAESAEARALTAEAALATMKQEHEALSQIAAVAIAERDKARAALAKAVEDEREACAYDAEHVLHGVSLAGVNKDYAEGVLESLHACAAAIRARSNGESP